MARKPIAQNGHSIYRTAAIEVDLQLVCGGSIVYLDSGGVQRVIRAEVGRGSVYEEKPKKAIHFPHTPICCLHLSSPQESYCRKVLEKKQF